MLAALVLAAGMYTVKAGDTLSGIVGNNWPAVCENNHISDCDLIYPGQEIRLSGGVAVTSSDPNTSAVSVQASESQPKASGGSLGCGGLESLWDSAGGNPGSAFIAASIAMAESGGNQYATGPVGEEGYWQINPVNYGMATYDPYGNARSAITLSGNGVDWSPWTTYTSGAYYGRC